MQDRCRRRMVDRRRGRAMAGKKVQQQGQLLRIRWSMAMQLFQGVVGRLAFEYAPGEITRISDSIQFSTCCINSTAQRPEGGIGLPIDTVMVQGVLMKVLR